MSKPILIVFLVIILAGSGVVFANTELPGDLVGFYSEFVENVAGTNDDGTGDDEPGDSRSDVAKAVHDALTGDENLKPGDDGFGQAVSDRAKDPEVDLGQEVSEAARNTNSSAGAVNDGEEPEDNRSDIAKAVHDALTGDEDIKPGDEDFGQAVSERAKDQKVDLGQEVSKAARNANDSAGTGSNGSPGNSGNAGGGGSPGNSGNAGGNGRGR